jgi:HD-like signal output (HDOD) protein
MWCRLPGPRSANIFRLIIPSINQRELLRPSVSFVQYFRAQQGFRHGPAGHFGHSSECKFVVMMVEWRRYHSSITLKKMLRCSGFRFRSDDPKESTLQLTHVLPRDSEAGTGGHDDTFTITEEQSAVLQRLAKLPPFPPAALRLLSVSAETGTAIEDFERVFMSDPALAADLLAVANSAAFGLRMRVESIRHAVTLLGLETVKSVGFTVAMGFYMRTSAPPMPLVQLVWSHSIATALIAERIGALEGLSLQGLYTAGLVHDFGRIGLLISEGAAYSSILHGEFGSVEEALSAEKQRFGATHTHAGALLAETWQFPVSLIDPIRRHHDDLSSCGDERLKTVQSACHLATTLGYGEFKGLGNRAAEVILPDKLRESSALDLELLRSKIKIVIGSVRPS